MRATFILALGERGQVKGRAVREGVGCCARGGRARGENQKERV
jgi:hypothetical protein